MNTKKILEWVRSHCRYQGAEYVEINMVEFKNFLNAMTENESIYLPKVANKCTEKAMRESRIHIGSDFNEFYIEALEATILDLTGKRVEDKKKLENKIAKRISDTSLW